MESKTKGSDYQIIRFHRGRPDATEKNKVDNPDLNEDDPLQKSDKDESRDLDNTIDGSVKEE